MRKRRVVGLLLLVAFIVPMGFNGLAFASRYRIKFNLKDKLYEISEKLNEIQDQLDQQEETPPTTLSTHSTWCQKLSGAERFELVLDGEAVMDKETDLVWEKSPSITPMNWFDAILHCYNRTVGGRKGWRLPTVEELASIVDTIETEPTLPVGHIFDTTAVQWSNYWSATTNAGDTDFAAEFAWVVHFGTGGISRNPKSTGTAYVWCVRGGYGYDGDH
ncbi:MAG: Lcl C-terminal domain-containing protein [Candidatus Brocadiales bacterium]